MTRAANQIVFSLSISAEDYLYYYKGQARHVMVQGQDGRTLRFPANLLQKFVAHDGIHGNFRLLFDDANKVISIEKIA